MNAVDNDDKPPFSFKESTHPGFLPDTGKVQCLKTGILLEWEDVIVQLIQLEEESLEVWKP